MGGQSPDPARAARPRRRLRKLALGALAVVAAAGLFVFGRGITAELPNLLGRVEQTGFWAPLVFILAYAVGTVAFVPGSLLTLASGAVFGIAAGAVYVFVGALIGSAGAFLMARYLARSAVERRLGGDPRLRSLDRAIGDEGRKIVFLLRLSPVFPYNLLNYALGLTRVRFADYLIASLGMIPGILLYVYSGRVIGDLALLAAGAPGRRGVGYYLVLGIGLAATIGVTFVITRLARDALREKVP